MIYHRDQAQRHKRLTIDAPITIHAASGTDTKAIADEVQKALDMREQRAAVHSRAFLYDTANA